MSSPGSAHLRFGCPQCGKRLKALPEQGGQEFACPQCAHRFRAPTMEEVIAEETGYHLGGSGAKKGADKESWVYTNCRVCGSSIAALSSRVGEVERCPDCHSDVKITGNAPKPKPFVSKVQPAEGDGGYRLAEEWTPPANPRQPSEERYFSISCPTCHTVLRAAQRHVGKRLPCPDCGTTILVPQPPAERPSKPAATLDDAVDFKLSEEVERPTVHLPSDDVKEARPKKARSDSATAESSAKPKRDDKATFSSARPSGAAASAARPGRNRPGLEPRPRERPEIEHEPGKPRPERFVPNEPFFKNFLRFFIYPAVWIRCLFFAAGAVASALLFVFAIQLDTSPIMMVVASRLHLLNMAITTVWAGSLFITCLTIANDTAEGHDEIQTWNDTSWGDWFMQGLWGMSALVFSILPVGLAMSLIGVPFLVSLPFAIASAFVFFPLVLLSMFAEESPMMPFSADVWRGPMQHSAVWAKFYLGAGALVGASFLGVGLTVAIGLISKASLYGVLPALTTILIAAQMIYFRLIGRLARLGVSEATPDDDDEE